MKFDKRCSKGLGARSATRPSTAQPQEHGSAASAGTAGAELLSHVLYSSAGVTRNSGKRRARRQDPNHAVNDTWRDCDRLTAVPIITHDSFQAPGGGKLWRYMDFTKFVSMLEESALYFPCLTEVQKLDPFEGSHVGSVWRLGKLLTAMGDGELVARSRASLQTAMSTLFISCWHKNAHESAAMWKLYMQTTEGIALQTTTQRLAAALGKSKRSIYMGKVRYIDYDRMSIGDNRDGLKLAMHKRASFAHEKEVRALLRDTSGKPGILVPIDVQMVAEAVVIAPGAPAWIADLVCKTLKRYGVTISVRQSQLLRLPSDVYGASV